jgi:hypothetical protein
MMTRIHDASAPSNDLCVGFDLSTRSARANWGGVGRESRLGLGIEPSILPINRTQEDGSSEVGVSHRQMTWAALW